jgi:hypothetical protein
MATGKLWDGGDVIAVFILFEKDAEFSRPCFWHGSSMPEEFGGGKVA